MNRLLTIAVVLFTTLAAGACAYIQHPKFRKQPEAARLQAIQASPNHSEGEFRNLVPTPVLADGSSVLGSFIRAAVEPRERPRPANMKTVHS